MSVKLIAVTKPNVEGINTSEELISYVARVSNPSNQLNTETAPKLLSYCIKHEHWSIFEHAFMTVEIKTTRAIAAQILRHRSFTFQEFSQRYSKNSNYFQPELRKQAENNRQSSTEIINNKSLESEITLLIKDSHALYTKLLDKGVAKECARMILPLCTETTMYMTGSCRSYIHYLSLRCKPDTQKEHREIAMQIKDIFAEQFPVVAEALASK